MKLKRASIITKVIIIALVVYAIIDLTSQKIQISNHESQNVELQAEVIRLAQANAELEYAIEHSGDPDIIEDIARDQLGLVMPGEKIFYDVSN